MSQMLEATNKKKKLYPSHNLHIIHTSESESSSDDNDEDEDDNDSSNDPVRNKTKL